MAEPALSPVAFSPDGARIAFSTARRVRVADLSGASREIAPTGVVTGLSWSPRLNLIAMIGGGAVWTMREDGGNRTRVALPGFALQAAWAPGSDRLAV
ncbi:MAG: TolB family protein, partial [Candidatus Binatia bacterium]